MVSPAWNCEPSNPASQVDSSSCSGCAVLPESCSNSRMPPATDAQMIMKKWNANSSAFTFGPASTTIWPRLSHRRAASCTAATQSGWTRPGKWGADVKAILSLPGGAPTSDRNGLALGGAQYGEVDSGPEL